MPTPIKFLLLANFRTYITKFMIGKYKNMKKLFIALLATFVSVESIFSQSKTITGGNDHGLIICAQGYLYTWGNNYSKTVGGPLLGIDPDDPKTGGNATKEYVTEPSRVKSGNLTFSQVTAGSGAFNLALACNSVVYAWGENTNGGCGQGPAGGNVIEYPLPVLKGETPGYDENGNKGGDFLGGVTYIAASTNSGFAIMDDGRVVGWGGGDWNGSTNKTSPVYIKDKAGNDIQNVTHISGGDHNCLIRTADGKLYGIGPWNGSQTEAVTYATPVLKEEDEEELTDIRMSAAGDVCGFAVTGDGFVWSWGNGGWGGSTGVAQTGANHPMARKVSSGEYKSISGEEYLTDVKEVIGGRGHGAAVTKEGYLVYWGCDEGNGGIAPVDATTAKTWASGGQGVKPVLARYCDASGKPGEVVKNAVSISRGDNFDFMMNDEDKYFVWGLNDLGQCGVGTTVSEYNCLVELKTIPCDIQDNCPEVFMTDQVKCPGEEIELDCGFVVPKGKEERYFIEWSFNGKVLNTTTKNSPKEDRAKDKYNVQSIFITEPGTYSVLVEYIGNNIPCDKCKPAETEITVEDMPMPIDTVLTTMQCVAEPLKPSKIDNICFEAVVNDKFYSAKDKVTFAAFSTANSKDTLEVFHTTGAGGEIKFCVSGDKVLDIHDNKDEESKDTIYNIWLEDVSKFETMLREGKPAASATGGSFQSYGMLLDMRASADLISFDIFAKSYNGEASVSVTPVIYMAEKNQNDLYVVGNVFWTGKAQTFTIDDSGPNKCTVKCDVRIPGSTARGIRYILGMKFTGNCTLYEEGVTVKPSSAEFPTPIIDSEKFGIYEMGATANSYTSQSNGSNKTCYYNVTFGKLTDYDCGRIMLSAQYGCPPCNRPNDLEITASETIKTDIDPKYKKVVELCKESDALTLNIEELEGKEATAKFDILWFDTFSSSESDALDKDVTGSAKKLEFKTDWATVAGSSDIEKDVEKVYYVMVRDNEKPTSKDCYMFDSIKVIAHPAPVDTLEWIEFCEGSLASEPTFEITGKTIKWVDEPKDVVDLTGPATTGTKEYTYKYTVVDDETGCESAEHTLTISVSKTNVPDVNTPISLLKNPANKFKLTAAINSIDPDCEIRWYESETATSELASLDIQLDEAKTIEVWAEQYNTKTGCTSERVKVEITINDAPVPEVTNESLCLDNEIPSLAEYVKAKDNDHELNWYDDPAAAKGTGSQTAPSFKATAAGTYKFYVSQTNTLTNAESEKATLTITVHEVATLDLSANKTEYCINETAEELTFKANSDGDFTSANWSKKSDMTDATATLTPTTDEKGTVTYYAQAEYTNKDAQKSYASTVCYGKIQDITVTTNKTEAPESETNYTVQYLKAEGDKNSSYKSLLDQDNTAVKAEAGHTLKWYDESKNPLSAEPSPEYIANETGERKVTYYVSQINTTTGCESELKEVTAIISSFPAPEVKALTFCQGSEELKSPYPLTATISTKGGFAAGDYQLIWYKQDPKANPSASEYITIDLSQEDLSYDYSTETEKDFKYWVVQRYLGPGGGQSPAAELLVTIYSKPILITSEPKPICLGGEVDLKDLYTISNRISNQQYELEYLSSSGTNPKGSIATEHGEYRSRAWFTLSSGEVCASEFAKVKVTVQELKVAIIGDNTTCPGIGVDLTAVLDSKNMNANDVPSYSWNVSPTGVTGQMETLNTSAEGLNKKGDKITVNLEVSMGACKGKKPVDAYIVTVDDPGVDGTIKFDEQYNTNSGKGTYTLSKNGVVEFDGCNSKVEVSFKVEQTEDEFTYENLETGEKKTGKFNNGEGSFDIKAGLYEVSYINTCATSFKFDVKDKSLDISGSPSNWSVCEGTPLTIKIVNDKDNSPFEYDPRKYKIEWQKDGVKLQGYDTEVLNIPSTTPADNGVYSYTVTSSGCVYHDKIAMGGSFTSKPKVKINESLLENKGVYEAVRTTAKDITIPIIQSIGIDMNKLNDKIVWIEDGEEVNVGQTLSLASVDSDHEYQIVIANGEKGYDTEYCGTSLDITLKADALLSIEAILVDTDGRPTKDMCLNEEGVGFQIDTTGTGKILHPDKFTFKIVETIDGVKKEIKWAKKDDYLFAEISPNKSATYDIIYKYEVGKQDSSKTSEITVHPAYEVDWDRNVSLCEGETGFIQITKAEPASEIELTWEADECLINGTKNGANVEAVFSGYGLSTKKALTLVASNGGICADKKFYPEFTIDKAIEGNIIAPEFVCEGHTATLDASPFKATEYVWSSIDQLGEGVTMYGSTINVVSKPGYASYTVEMKRGACTQTADATIEVRYAPRFDRIDSLSFRSVEIVLQTNTGTAPFQYIVDDNYDENIGEPVKDNLEYGNHNIKIIDAAGCQIDSSFVTHAPGLEFPIHISPNGDGINDAFSIPVLRDAYPEANIRIFDRWGKKLADYKAGNSELDWDGTYNGVQMPSTDYWYEIEIKEIKKTYTGHFTLIRQ